MTHPCLQWICSKLVETQASSLESTEVPRILKGTASRTCPTWKRFIYPSFSLLSFATSHLSTKHWTTKTPFISSTSSSSIIGTICDTGLSIVVPELWRKFLCCCGSRQITPGCLDCWGCYSELNSGRIHRCSHPVHIWIVGSRNNNNMQVDFTAHWHVSAYTTIFTFFYFFILCVCAFFVFIDTWKQERERQHGRKWPQAEIKPWALRLRTLPCVTPSDRCATRLPLCLYGWL